MQPRSQVFLFEKSCSSLDFVRSAPMVQKLLLSTNFLLKFTHFEEACQNYIYEL